MNIPQSTPDRFAPAQRLLHWAVVILLLLQYVVFESMGRAFRTLMESGTATYGTTQIAHIGIGIAVLVLALVRVALRLRDGVPPPPTGEPDLFVRLSKLTHLALYALLFLIPLAGLVAWFGQVRMAAEAHEVMASALQALVLLHVGAVLVHQFYWKTNLIRRMI